jgi:hypothetical protein
LALRRAAVDSRPIEYALAALLALLILGGIALGLIWYVGGFC